MKKEDLTKLKKCSKLFNWFEFRHVMSCIKTANMRGHNLRVGITSQTTFDKLVELGYEPYHYKGELYQIDLD